MKRKLRKWVKVVLTVVIIIISAFIYSKAGIIGELAQVSKLYQVVCFGAWSWLLAGQIMIYSYIWSK